MSLRFQSAMISPFFRTFLPIKAIDNIPVDVLFKFEWKLVEQECLECDGKAENECEGCGFEMIEVFSTMTITHARFNKTLYHCVLVGDSVLMKEMNETLESAMSEAHETLSHLIFDNTFGSFVLSKISAEVSSYFANAKYESNLVTTKTEECCVCYMHTMSKTYCKHSLCIRCISRLSDIKCPMCRKLLR